MQSWQSGWCSFGLAKAQSWGGPGFWLKVAPYRPDPVCFREAGYMGMVRNEAGGPTGQVVWRLPALLMTRSDSRDNAEPLKVLNREVAAE